MRLIRRLMLAVVLAVSMTLLVPSAPAQAWQGEKVLICFQVGTTPWGTPVFDCYYIYLPKLGPVPPFPPDCIVCDLAIDFGDDKIRPEIRESYLEQFGKGLGRLSEAALTEDPKAALQLRNQATEAFLASAEVLGDNEAPFSQAGWVDQKSGKFYEDEVLAETGQNLAAGLQLMQQSLHEPDPLPWIQEGMGHFDQSLAGLTKIYAG